MLTAKVLNLNFTLLLTGIDAPKCWRSTAEFVLFISVFTEWQFSRMSLYLTAYLGYRLPGAVWGSGDEPEEAPVMESAASWD